MRKKCHPKTGGLFRFLGSLENSRLDLKMGYLCGTYVSEKYLPTCLPM